uniref:Uncharacterized protein n=1 Tax=Scophthalmus maximus TaxID=52904 RepID=A0A8D3E2L5_SCOMX
RSSCPGLLPLLGVDCTLLLNCSKCFCLYINTYISPTHLYTFYNIFLTGKGCDGTRTELLGPAMAFLYYKGRKVCCESRNDLNVAHNLIEGNCEALNDLIHFSCPFAFICNI